MNSLPRNTREHDQDERVIRSLCDRTGASRADVGALFSHELARLALGARVRSYLRLLAAANVHATLRRRRKQQDSHAATDVARMLDPTTATAPSRWRATT